MLIWHTRDEKYDLYNVIQKSDMLSLKLFNCHALKKYSQSRLNCTELWANDSLPYKSNKYVLNKSFEIPITPDIQKNLTNIYLLLKIQQKNCDTNCPTIQQSSQILHWFIPRPYNSRILISTEPSPTPTPSSTPVPFNYKTTRFDLLEHEIVNPQVSMPWLTKNLMSSQKRHQFYPVLTVDNFFDIPSERQRINMSLPNFTVNVEINIRKDFIWNTKNYIQYSIDMSKYILNSEFLIHNAYQIKRIFIETNPVLLWTTGIATVLHMIFQMLAFERDLAFWSHKKSLVGVSLRTNLLQLGSKLILYFNTLESPRFPLLIKIMDFIDICIQVWKILRMMKLSSRFPFIVIREEYQGETDDADSVGFTYLSYALIPLIVVYSVYQLFYVKYPSVKSYILHCSSGAVYSFGFLAMLPQLYVNYKLKTVAGMSRSAFVYKFISTFIDDLYTFVTDLPLMYKIACFRDDVIFFFWIFQCFIYPVDPKRPNEYGFVEKGIANEEEEESKEELNKIKDHKNKQFENNGQKAKTD